MAREVLFKQARGMVTLTQVLDLIGWKPQCVEPKGPRGKCPIHVSGSVKSRSFHHDGMYFHCETCEAFGDWIKLIEHVRSTGPRGAVSWVFKRLGLTVPRGGSLPRMPRVRYTWEQEEGKRGAAGVPPAPTQPPDTGEARS
jgi:hypothetical protein